MLDCVAGRPRFWLINAAPWPWKCLWCSLFLLFSLLLPLADVAIAGFQYISAMQALRAFGQSIQYSPPPDFTNTSDWVTTAIAKADPRYPISNFKSFAAMQTLPATAANARDVADEVLFVLDDHHFGTHGVEIGVVYRARNCTFTLSYSERFQ